jgi:glycosyltransferase involved in cell wall biosynthesis
MVPLQICPMRIAIPSTFPPFRGGISQFNEALKSAFEAAGHEVLVINWTRQYPQLFFPGKQQIDPELPAPYPAELDSVRPTTWRKVGKELAHRELDWVVVPFWHAALAPALSGTIRALKKHAKSSTPRVIGLVHNAGSHDASWWDAALTKRFLSSVDVAWTLSEEVSERLGELKPDLACQTLFHPLYDHFPDLMTSAEAKAKLHLPENARVLLYFGLIRPYKGLEVLLDAFSRLDSAPDSPIHLLIGGECYGDWEPYERLIESNSACARIQTHERFISDREVGLFFGAADVVALPYRRASQSGVTAVALHYGKPIVASNVGGLAEYILPGQTGELAPPNDAESLAEALRRALSQRYPATAFDAARERFSWSAFVEQAMRSPR